MKPMLAGKANLATLRYPVLASRKLDGVRALVIDGVVYSRNMKPIPSLQVQKMWGRKQFNGLDGELIYGPSTAPDVFRRTTSAVMSTDRWVVPLWFYVFDTFAIDAPYGERLAWLTEKFWASELVSIIPQLLVRSEVALQNYEKSVLAAGYEGLMLRSTDGPYKQGRSTEREGYLLKLKRFEQGEAIVIGYEEEMHNANEKVDGKRTSHKAGKSGKGTLGAIQVRDTATGATFSIGSGFTASERADLWAERKTLIDRICRYSHFAVGAKDAPRFPTFVAWRNDL